MGDFVDALAKGSSVIRSVGNEDDFAVGVVGSGVDLHVGSGVGLGVFLVKDVREAPREDCGGDDKAASGGDLSESVGDVFVDVRPGESALYEPVSYTHLTLPTSDLV